MLHSLCIVYAPLGLRELVNVESKYSEVMATGKYDNVVNYFGESVEHYGKTDAQTYFAEVCFQTGSSSV